MILSGWGRYPTADCETKIIRNINEIQPEIARCHSLIARGTGRAYGDAAINTDSTLFMGACDRFLEFDTRAGTVECEAGVLLSDLLEVVVARGWFPPVVPGTKFVTIGGLIAADVHGKNHHVDGSFGRYVESLRLAMANGTIVNCSRSENSEIFAATLGGMGLTGIVLSARLQLRRVASNLIDETIIRAKSLTELLQLFDDHRKVTYSVAWIDCLAEGDKFGRGVLMLGEHFQGNVAGEQVKRAPLHKRATRLSVPMELPISPLNKWTIKFFNELYYRLNRSRRRRVPYDGFFFPLDAILNWNRIYGRSGFIQYQCVIGGGESELGLRRVLKVVGELGLGSFLAVLKKLGTGTRYLSFPMEGYTITLDFPVRPKVLSSLAKLDAIVAEHKGRIYLAKDARASRQFVEQGYPEIETFRKLRRSIDPSKKFRSALSERLDL
jgi:FAD/FMN-containing dehydrogenase